MTLLESPNAKLRVQLPLVQSHPVSFMMTAWSAAAQSSLTGVFSPGPVCEMSAHAPLSDSKAFRRAIFH